MNKDNLIPCAHKLTPEENRLGGVNSGISRREKKRALEIARDILSMPVDDGHPVDVNDISSLKNVHDVTTDVMTSILAKISQKAINGDIKASKLLLTISGDYTTKTEALIGINEDTEQYAEVKHIIHAGEVAPYNREVQYFDRNGNIVKRIYGEEAQKLIDKQFEEDRRNGVETPSEVDIIGVDVKEKEDLIG